MVDEEIKDVPTGPPAPRSTAMRGASRRSSKGKLQRAKPTSRPRTASQPRAGLNPALLPLLARVTTEPFGRVGWPHRFSARTGRRLHAFCPERRCVGDRARLGEVEAQAQRDRSALTAVAGLDKRVAALEAASAGNGAVSEATQRLAAQTKDLRSDVDAEKGAIPELSARVAKLETDTQKPSGVGPDAAALADRIDKVELRSRRPRLKRAPPPRGRRQPTTPPPSPLSPRLRTKGCARARVLHPNSPLRRLGVDAAALAPLQAVANGAPTNSALAASFSAVAPHVLAATSKAETGSVSDRFLAHLHSLVKVRELNETAGDDPPALVSQIEAASGRGDIGAALASFDKLPEAARKAAGDWPTLARARQAADTALQAIREAAIGRLAGPNP